MIESVEDFKQAVNECDPIGPTSLFNRLQLIAQKWKYCVPLANIYVSNEGYSFASGYKGACMVVCNTPWSTELDGDKLIPADVDIHKTDDVEVEYSNEQIRVECDHKVDKSGTYEKLDPESGKDFPDVWNAIENIVSMEQGQGVPFNDEVLSDVCKTVSDDTQGRAELYLRESGSEERSMIAVGNKGVGLVMGMADEW